VRPSLLFLPSAACHALLLLTLSGAGGALADTVALAPVQDTSLYSEDASGSNGSGDGMFAARTQDGAIRRALMAFDVAAAVPAGSTITGAQLDLTSTRYQGGAEALSIHLLLADWGVPGGDFAPAASADFVAMSLGVHVLGPTAVMTSDVQGWLDAPATNFGWLLKAEELVNGQAWRFATREAASPDERPRLTIEYTVTAAENCANGVDDDGDGAIDCADPDCASDPACLAEDCSNGVDDDGDGAIDCADPDCASDPACLAEDCANGVDDDGDGAIDCADPDCASDPACLAEDCSNGVDDDGDGATDCADPDCAVDSAWQRRGRRRRRSD